MRTRHWLGPALMLALPFALPAQDADPPARVGRISSMLGTVSFQAAGATEWSQATLNYTVTTGDRLFTGEGARAEVEVGSFGIRLGDSTDLNVTNLTDHFAQLGVPQGTLRVSMYRLARGDSVEVDTPNGALIIRTPGQYRVEIPINGTSTLVTVDDGTLDVSGPGTDETLARGQSVELTGTGPIQVAAVSHPPATAFDQWSADRDRRVAASSCSQYVSRDMPGCADLSDNGRWQTDPTYGSVWYPTAVPAGWAPYRYGHWAWIEPWGWTWVEDEPWGFAPFHYGRWVTLGGVWAWAPGPMVAFPYYGPAFVAFVGGPEFGFGVNIGLHAWFPLGPREPYFPWYHHSDGYLREVNIRNVRNVRNVNAFLDVRNVDHIAYVNRERATTAVPTATFRGGLPVARAMVQVRAADVVRAPIAPHPWVTPTANAAIGGRPVARGPTAPRPQAVAARPMQNSSPRVITRNAPPVDRSPAVARAQPQRQSAQPTGGGGVRGRTVITRNAPPAQQPPFDARERAMQQNPGRPLEPQQIHNMQAGRPAGPQRDLERAPRQAAPAARPQKPAEGKKPGR